MIDAVSTDGIIAKQPTRLDVPIREIVDRESIALGFRQEMLSMDDKGCVMVGIASDFIILKWGKRTALVRGSELLRAWVATFAPEDTKRFPDEINH